MKTRYLWIALLVGSMSSLGGCIVVNGSDAYEDCVDSLDCRSARHNCPSITVNDTGASGAMCSVVDCLSDLDCDNGRNGQGGACLNVLGAGINICYETCASDLDCTQGGRGWSCQPTTAGVNICLPGASAPPPPALSLDYEGCSTTPDCAAGLSCATITTESAADEMCTFLNCVGDADCGGSANGEPGACLEILGSGGNVCYERCATNADCTGEGWTCADATDEFGSLLARICLPF